MKKEITNENISSGRNIFDLGEDGDFHAYSYEILSANTARFFGKHIPVEGEPQEASLFVVFAEDIGEDEDHVTLDEAELLHAGWDEYELELD